ncbi:penicillin-binding protein 2 [Anaplasmataceae bacterium AB001_6]|nr:penicillin-binding protein 2 [Anaplasmataceae bacterium AB001_6]
MKPSLKITKRRSLIIYILMIIGFLLLITKMLMIQKNSNRTQKRHNLVIDKEFYHAKQNKINIYDRNGFILSGDLTHYSLYIKPEKILEKELILKDLHNFFPDMQYNYLKDKIYSNKAFAWIKKNISAKDREKMLNQGIPFLHFIESNKRYYPHNNLFSHVIGFVDIDNNGIAGFEHFLEKNIQKEEIANYIEDNSITLSLDLFVQYIVRDELEKAYKETQSIGGAAILMNIKNGEIISTVSVPDFNPNNPYNTPPDNTFNRSTFGLYEMGSAFKIFTVSAALDSSLVSTEDSFDTTKQMHIGDYKISDYISNIGQISLTDAIVKSSNKAILQIMEKLGSSKQKDFFDKIHIFEQPNIEISEKSNAIVPAKWSQSTAATASYGYGVAISLLQLTQGIATMVNDGYFIPSTIIKGKKNNREKIISSETSEKVRKIMLETVERGTAKSAKITNYKIGGKTGSAEKNINGKYVKNKNIATFVAFFPYEEPKYVLAIMLDEPKRNNKALTGGTSAAPVGKEIIKKTKAILTP